MARGRFISASISTSRKFEAVATNDHRLMYLMLVPHVDCEGRHAADARILAGQVYTLLELTRAQIDAGIRDLQAVGLIRLYEVGGEPFLEVVDFHEHNKVRRDKDGGPTHEAPSRIPPSSDGNEIEHAAEPLRSGDVAATAQVEVEVEVQGEVQDEDLTPTSTSLSATPTRELQYQHLVEVWNQHRGALPAVKKITGERRRQMARFINEHGPDAADTLADAARAVAGNSFWISRQYGFKNLLAGDKVTDYAEQWRAGNIQLGDANLRMATQVDRWARALDAAPERPVN